MIRPVRAPVTESPVMGAWDAAVKKLFRGRKMALPTAERQLKDAIESGLTGRGLIVVRNALFREQRTALIAAAGYSDATAIEVKLRPAKRGAKPTTSDFWQSLAKLEALLIAGYPQRAVLLALTNEPKLLENGEGKPDPFNIAKGRLYLGGTKLLPARIPVAKGAKLSKVAALKAANQAKEPPFVLRGRYEFDWRPIGNTGWFTLALWTAPSLWAQAGKAAAK